ncbi:BOLA class I histocompatibility antigen, alpha chain BL3-7-like isoform X2 [Pangasianodon hypophthalmus]|uniref:BOLA class I histocompatibility antigen, alpha chain BL3-7-like isoform X2 n=1 Tax=Pangasianodon hypophthalmus TaxID=310915 RepID=UPI000EFDD607|nr:BOLA class I histocompatibility antigen, alpha chain BL3-7-like isoform X2 [Pangasianodon hypophthalmus]
MEHSSGVTKVLLLFTFSVHLSSAETHTLDFFYTGVTPGTNFPEFTVVGVVDGEQIVHYDSSTSKTILKKEWMKDKADVADFWNRETDSWQEEQEWLKTDSAALRKRFNHTKGVQTVQIMFGCELNDDGTTTAYSQFGYNGEDLIRLDLKTVAWVLAKPQAVFTEKKWDPTGHEADYCTEYLKNDCITMLKKFVSYSRESKVRPEVSVFQKHSPYPEVVCHATGFFPKAVVISWQKDGEEVHENVALRETLPNLDGSFQKRSILTVPAEELQKHTYTCVIQHSSLEKELVLPVRDGAPIAIIVALVAVVFALVAVVAGIVVWKKKNSGFSRVPPKPSSEGDSSSNNS